MLHSAIFRILEFECQSSVPVYHHAVNNIQPEVIIEMLKGLVQLPPPEHEAAGSISICHPLSPFLFRPGLLPVVRDSICAAV